MSRRDTSNPQSEPVETFMRSFTQQEPIPEAAIARAVEVMRSGRLHRYNTAKDEVSETALLEQEFAAYLGVRYCLACASGGFAMAVALRAFGLEAGEAVATSAFTLSPVPGAIHAAGGRPVLVESTENLVLDLEDLEYKLKDSGARILLLSHMRGHLVDMDALTEVLNRYGVALIEDCAHTMGAAWKGRPSGTFGTASCFSTQTYKHLNSGEGGFVTTDNPELMARAVILSGSYMFYDRHLAGPDDSVYTDIRLDTPNCSGRMDNLRAALLRPQLTRLDENVRRWNARYRAIEQELSGVKGLHLPRRLPEETFVGSSFQFRVPSLSPRKAEGFVAVCRTHGVELKWFGATEPVGYTSQHHSWRYSEPQIMPQTDHILQGLFDMRIPLTFSVEDCRLIGRIIRTNLETVVANNS